MRACRGGVDDGERRLSAPTGGEIQKFAVLLDDGPKEARGQAWRDELRATFAAQDG